MNKYSFLLLGFLVILLACENESSIVLEDEEEDLLVAEMDSTKRDSILKAHEKAMWLQVEDLPENDFREAYYHFKQGKYMLSSKEIDSASAYVKKLASHSHNDTKKFLTTAFKRLDSLSSKVKRGPSVTENQIGNVFKETHKSIASYYIDRSIEAHNKNEHLKSSKWLKAASKNIQNGFYWTDEKVDRRYLDIMYRGRLVSDKMEKEGKGGEKETKDELKFIKEKYTKNQKEDLNALIIKEKDLG